LWIWIIFMFPLVGLAAYLYLEVRPTWSKLGLESFLWNLKSPGERIRILESRLAESTTVKNRLALADELHAARKFERACTVLSEGLRGAFRDDAQLMLRLAEAHLEAGRTADAETIVNDVIPGKSPDLQLQHALLKARIAAHQGRTAEAESLFATLMSRKNSEGPRYFFAEYLLATGRHDEARAMLRDILHKYRRGTVVWRYQERKWFYASRSLLKSPPAPAALSATNPPSGITTV
jgi:hypothetical protein